MNQTASSRTYPQIVVLVGAFLISFLVEGVCFSFSQFYLDVLEEFDEDGGNGLAHVSSAVTATYLLVGIFSVVLLRLFRLHQVVLAGTFIASSGLFLSSLVNSATQFYITYAGITGFGLGLMYLPSVTLMHMYFEKRRALAVGVAFSGSALIVFIVPLFCTLLLRWYDWRNSYRIIAALFLHSLLCCVAYKFRSTTSEASRKFSSEISFDDSCVIMQKIIRQKKLLDNNSNGSLDGWIITNSNQLRQASPMQTISRDCDFALWTPLRRNAQTETDAVYTSIDNLQRNHFKIIDNYQYTLTDDLRTKSLDSGQERIRNKRCCCIRCVEVHTSCKYRLNLCMINCSLVVKSVFMDFVHLLRKLSFILFLMSACLSYLGFYVPVLLLADQALVAELDFTDASSLLQFFSMGFLMGRLLPGLLLIHPCPTPHIVNCVALLVSGVVTCVVPMMTSYGSLSAYAVCCGCCLAIFMVLRTILLTDLYGVDSLESSFAILCFLFGILSYLAPILTDYLYGLLGSLVFCVGGFLISAGGLVGMILTRVAKWERIKEMQTHVAPSIIRYL